MFKKITIIFFVSVLVQSCVTKKTVWYYQDTKDKIETLEQVNYFPAKVQINDILYVKITALMADTAEPFNIVAATATSDNASVQNAKLQGYLVSSEGTIFFPILGTIKVAGKTIIQTQDAIKALLDDGKYVKNPIVTVRIVNNKFTVLGEVNSPGTYDFSEQSLTINQALGMCGDLKINGLRKNVLLIREVNGVRTYVHLDLTDSKLFDSPYYYIKQNDVIIVNANPAQVATAGYVKDAATALGFVTLVLTTILLVNTL